MPIFFKPSASDFSLSADSIGNRWLQEPVVRPNGFPLYLSLIHISEPTRP